MDDFATRAAERITSGHFDVTDAVRQVAAIIREEWEKDRTAKEEPYKPKGDTLEERMADRRRNDMYERYG